MTDAGAARRPKGRTLAEFGKLSAAEQKLLDCAAAGEIAVLGGVRPESGTDANTVRGAFIRFLALGGNEEAPVHEKGVWLHGAWIEGESDFTGVETKGGLSLTLSVFGESPAFYDARIKGSLNFGGSKMPGLIGDRLTCDGSMYLGDKFFATGEVRLPGTKIKGDFVCSGGSFQNEGSCALRADGIDVGGDALLDKTFTATGAVLLIGAKIGDNFACSGGTFQNIDKDTLIADRINVRGSVFMSTDFKSTGQVRLPGAKIGGSFVCSDGTFQNNGKDSLIADGIDVGGSVFLSGSFKATGMVRLPGAKIGDNFECSGGTFQNMGGYALAADRIDVGGNLFLNKNCSAEGTIRLHGAKIRGNLVLDEGHFGSSEVAVAMQSASVLGVLMIANISIDDGVIDLTSAKSGLLVDHADSWNQGVILDGFVYGAFGGKAPTDAKMRIGWLDKQPGAHSGKDGNGSTFRPQPWQQLRKVLREMGHYEAAREVGIAFERRKRECGLVGLVPEISASRLIQTVGGWVYGKTARLLHMGYGALVGYGYRPLRLLMIAAIVWVICGGAYFAASRWEGAFVPSTQSLFSQYGRQCGLQAHVRWTDCKAIRFEYPQFYPLVYSLNVLLPVGNLGQEATWRPETATLGGLLAQCAVWFETLFGWVASLVLVAVVSGLAKRDE